MPNIELHDFSKDLKSPVIFTYHPFNNKQKRKKKEAIIFRVKQITTMFVTKYINLKVIKKYEELFIYLFISSRFSSLSLEKSRDQVILILLPLKHIVFMKMITTLIK